MTTEEKLKWQLEVCGIDKYHKKGFTGKGITVLCPEDGDHAKEAMRVLGQVAPDAFVIYSSVIEKSKGGKMIEYNWQIDGRTYSFDDVMEIFKPDIISCSLRDSTHSTDRDNIVKPYIDKGELIIVTCAGNEGASDGVQTRYKSGLTIGSVQFYNNKKTDIRHTSYSGRTKNSLDIDYVGFMWDWNGTSAATPFVAGQIALFMSRYGKVSQTEFQKIIKPYCKDLGEENKDWIYGDGLIVLPDEDDIVLRGEKDMFKDVEDTRWSKNDIEWAVDIGIVEGFEDNTFRPAEAITREQACVIIRRLYNSIKKD